MNVVALFLVLLLFVSFCFLVASALLRTSLYVLLSRVVFVVSGCEGESCFVMNVMGDVSSTNAGVLVRSGRLWS